MEFWTDVWNKVVDLHASGDLALLVPFYGVVVALILFVCLQVMLVRGRRMALQAAQTTRDLLDDMTALHSRVGETEERVEQRLDARTGDLDTRMTRKIDQKGDALQERLEQHRSALSEVIGKGEARLSRLDEQLKACRERIDEVEARIPNLFDRLDDFREMLGRTFQAELGGVFDSFDNSVSAILQQMKSELQLGVSRIESIEGMVRSREKAERSLLGGRGEPALPGAAAEPEESDEFEVWEQEAKDLVDQDQDEDEDEDEDRPEPDAESAASEPEDDAEITDYPAEMEAVDAEADVDSELLAMPLNDEDPDAARDGDARA
ncbi:MAG: hypothetical protein GXY85_06815 [Candidatus Brocadiaceae bacterium]|nr:hypothetical protein [Candidatus Brocadiaceae bacterium]